jgi:hypothetical protein
MNRSLLKEAIADAKAVKETAIANAKAALEEAFTPYLKEKLAAKLAEMDDMDEAEDKMMAEEKEMEENFDLDEMSHDVDEATIEGAEEMEEGKDLEEMDLDELLRELEGMEEGEKEEMTEGEEDLINDPKGPTAHGNVAEEEDMEMGEEDEEMDLENMTEEDLKSFIESVIADMVAAGELEGEMEGGEEMEGGDEMGMEDEEVDIEELLAELMTERKKYGGNKGDIPAKKRGDKKDTAEEEGVEDYKKKTKKMEEQLAEAHNAIKTIQSELNEVNLLNAKLLYTNKIFRARTLSESQKVKVLEAFDKASSVKEVKLVFETLSNSAKEKKSSINESMFGGASKASGIAPTAKKPIFEVNDQFARWQTLAGIKK